MQVENDPNGTAQPHGVELVADLVPELRHARTTIEALQATLHFGCRQLGATAGAAWARDPAGQLQLLQILPDESSIDESLLRTPNTDGHSGPVRPIKGSRGVDLIMPSAAPFTATPLGVVRLVGLQDNTGETGPTSLVHVVADLLGQQVELLHERQYLADVARLAGIGTWEWLATTNEVLADEQMYRLLGVLPDDFDHTLEGYLAQVHPDDRPALVQQVEEALDTPGQPWRSVHRLVGDDGTIRWVEGRGDVAVDAHGTPARMWGVGQDVTERQRLARQLDYLENHDELTGLFNRWAFERALDRAAQSAPADTLVVALADVNEFRDINEHLGHAVGDQVLREVATRLRDCLPEATMVARLGADEFALLVAVTPDVDQLDAIGERLAACASTMAPVWSDDQPPTIRVGVAANTDGTESGDDLWQAASVAMQVAGNRTTASWQVFDADKHGATLERLAIESDLRRALEQGTIDIAYQPILAMDSGAVVGFEALARWERPGHGFVSPGTFIPLAERAGLIGHLGALVLRRACQQLRDWDRHHGQTRSPYVAVNISSVELDDPALPDLVHDALSRSGLPPHRLVLEVTETSLAHDTPGALARLFELRRQGVRVAIDDFGTGYSSLSRLRELPFDVLKIDRSFIGGITSRHTPVPILQALFSMARSLDLDVIAEGVETPVQVAALLSQECGYVQGFLFSRPVAPDDMPPHVWADGTWDPPAIASQVPPPVTSPELQRLLDQLATPGGDPTGAVLEETLQVIAELTSFDSVYVTRIDLRQEVQEILTSANVGPLSIPAGAVIPWEETLCRRAIADAREVIADAPGTYPDAMAAIELGIQTYIGVELYGPKGGLRGTLCGASGTLTDVPQETRETFHWVARLLADHVQMAPGG